MKLNELRDNPGARKARMRIGRGIGSGKGKTGGRGVKGQKSRTGVALKGFEGGQMPVYRRLPKRGFINPFGRVYALVNLGRVQAAIDAGRIDPAEPITPEVLKRAGVVGKRLGDGVRLLAKGKERFATKADFTVTGASLAAIAAVEAAGGRVTFAAVAAAAATSAEPA